MGKQNPAEDEESAAADKPYEEAAQPGQLLWMTKNALFN